MSSAVDVKKLLSSPKGGDSTSSSSSITPNKWKNALSGATTSTNDEHLYPNLKKEKKLKIDNEKKYRDSKKKRVAISVESLMNKTYKLEKESITGSSSNRRDMMTVLVPEERLTYSQESNKRRSALRNPDTVDDDVSGSESMYDGSISSWRHMTSSRSVASVDYSVTESMTSRTSFGTMVTKEGGSTYMSYREIVEDIEKRAKTHRPPPEYITTIDKLPSLSVSWDGRKKRQKKTIELMKKLKEEIRASSSSSTGDGDSSTGDGGGDSSNPHLRKLIFLEKLSHRPVINLMGCHYQPDLIMAKANERIRRQQHATTKSKRVIQSRLEHIENVIEEKLVRQKKYAMIRITRSLQSKWILCVTMLKFIDRVNDYAHEIKRGLAHMFRKESAGSIIIRVMSRWYQRWLFRKYRLGFERAVKRSRGRLVIGVRIMKKNIAMKKLKWFLTECKPKPAMATVVHRFVKNVHYLQKVYHAFCKCKAARISVITKIWDSYEAKYIKKKLREKKEKKVVGKSTSFETLDIDFKLKLEMEKQDDKWKLADMKMEEQLLKVAATGNLKRASDADAINKLLLDDKTKFAACRAILEQARRDHLEDQREQYRKFLNKTSTVSNNDAKQLLKLGTGEDLLLLEQKMNNQLHGFRTGTFFMFKYITRKIIIEKMKAEHDRAGTFVMKKVESGNRKRTSTAASPAVFAAAAAVAATTVTISGEGSRSSNTNKSTTTPTTTLSNNNNNNNNMITNMTNKNTSTTDDDDAKHFTD